jgi:hypothetical protein
MIKDWAKKLSIKDLIMYILIVIILVIAVIYVFQKKDINKIDTANLTTTSTSSKDTTTNKTTSTSKVIPFKNVTSRCNFRVTYPTIYTGITMPFTVKGILDKADTSKGCLWNELDSRAGDAEIFYNKNGEGWKSAGAAVPIITRIVPGGATTTMAFTVSFNLYVKALGLKSGTPIKIAFTELNIPPQPNPDTFDFQVSLK